MVVLSLLGALGYAELELRRIGATLQVVDVAYLPITRLEARLGGEAPAVERSLAEARARVTRAETLPIDAEERAALAALRAQLDQIGEATRDPARARRSPRDALRQLGILLDSRIAAVSERTALAHRRAERVGAVLLVSGALLGLALLAGTRSALAPIRALTEQARRVAAGDPAPPIAVRGAAELATLARAFNRMVDAVEDRDRNLLALTTYLRRVLDALDHAVIVAEDGAVRMGNPAAAALWSVREGDPLPAELSALPEGRHVERALGGRIVDVAVVPFGEAGILLVGEDVAQRVADRGRLARSERLALVGQLLAQVTHEVRNPLNAISLHAELLAEEPLDPEAMGLLATITGEIRRLETLTGRYLDLARPTVPERGPAAPRVIAQSVADLHDEAHRRGGARITVRGDADTHDMHGEVLRRALLNLVRNAVEAGARTVDVEVRDTEDTVTVTVRDDGAGMSADVAGRIFEPFYTTRARGTGLGLAVVRQELEDVGGTITLETAPGTGTTFVLALTGCPRV